MNKGRFAKILSDAGKWLLPLSAFLYSFSLFFPWIAGPPSSPDDSWKMVLHAAFIQHLQFGRDIIFTFGPWGFLYGGYCPETYSICVAAWTISAFVFWWAGWRVASHFSGSRLLAWLWYIAFAGIAGIRQDQTFDVRMTGWGLLLLFLCFFVENGPVSVRQILLVAVSGMLALVKFTGFIELTIVVMLITAADIFYRRRIPWLAAWFVASVLFFWVLSGQSLVLLGPFLRCSWILAGNYTEAMMQTAPAETETLVCLLLVMTGLIAVTGYAAWRQCRFFGLYPVAGLGTILFLVFKHGFVRCDPIHESTSTLEVLLATLACLAVTWPVLRGKRRWLGAGAFIAVLGVFVFCSNTFNRCYREDNVPDERLWLDFAWTLDGRNLLAPVRLLRDPKHLLNIYTENLATVRSQCPLPPLKGGVDVYPWRQAVLFAQGLEYAPRPVIQSYSAYTPELAEINAAHLRGERAPENILFEFKPTSRNFPALDDGLSWLEILSRYDVKGTAGGFVILKRSPEPRTYHLTPLTDTLVRFGETTPLATNHDLVWAEVEIRQTLWGRIAATVYKPPVLQLIITLRDGRRLDFHVNPGMTQSGFLLSPLIQNNADFMTLANCGGPDLTGSEVISATISAATPSGGTLAYQPAIRLRLYQLAFQH